MKAEDNKLRLTDAAIAETLLRLIHNQHMNINNELNSPTIDQ